MGKNISMSLVGRAALITGAVSGLRLSFSRALLQEGCRVNMVDINPKGESGFSTFFTQCDVTDSLQLEAAFKKTSTAFGYLDVVCNNAGVSSHGDWQKTLATNLRAVIEGTFLAVEYISTRHGGRGGLVVNTASFGGLVPMSFEPVYCASKHGVIGFTRSLFRLMDSDGVRVNALCPSYTDTPMVAESMQDPMFKRIVKATGLLSVDMVTQGLLRLISDKDKSGEVLTITTKHGIHYETFRYEAAKL